VSNLSIKDVPEAWAEALRQRAARNHRSLQGELMAILENAVADSADVGRTGLSSGGMGRSFPGSGARPAWKSIEEVAAELRARFPQGLPSGPSSIDLIRQDRDAR
jgi:plasmid stability protein